MTYLEEVLEKERAIKEELKAKRVEHKKATQRLYRIRNAERLRTYQKKYYAEHSRTPEQRAFYAERQRRYYAEHPERKMASCKKWQWENAEHLTEYRKKYFQEHKDELLEYQRNYRKNMTEEQKERQRAYQREYARKYRQRKKEERMNNDD